MATIATKLSTLPYGSILHLANHLNNGLSNRLVKLALRVTNAVFLPLNASICARYNLVVGIVFLVTLVLSFPFVASSSSLLLFSHGICHIAYYMFDGVLAGATSNILIYTASVIFFLFKPNALSITTDFLNLAQKAIGNIALG